MSLKDLVRQLADLTWTLEQQTQRPADTAVLGYVQDAVNVEIEYRRRMRDLEHRLGDILGSEAGSETAGTGTQSSGPTA